MQGSQSLEICRLTSKDPRLGSDPLKDYQLHLPPEFWSIKL